MVEIKHDHIDGIQQSSLDVSKNQAILQLSKGTESQLQSFDSERSTTKLNIQQLKPKK